MGEHALYAPVNSKRLTSALPRARERSGLSGLVIPRRRTVSIIAHCRVRYGGVAEREVLHHRAGEQLHDLRHDAQHPAAFRFIEPCGVAARDTDAPAPWLVEAGHQVQRARLACPGASDEGHVFATLHVEGNPVQHGLAPGVAKLHATQHDRPRPDLAAVTRDHRRRSVGRQGESAEDAFCPGHGPLHGLPLLA